MKCRQSLQVVVMMLMTSKNVVVIPMYKVELTKNELHSVLNTCKVLSRHDIVIASPKKLNNFLQKFIETYSLNVRVVYYSNRYFKSIKSYNKLLLSRKFYIEFSDYKFLLIVQTDAFVFSDKLDLWARKGYSYVGAPWFDGFDKPSLPLTFHGVGNGGFSLRKVDHFLKVLSTPRKVSYPTKYLTGLREPAILRKVLHSVFCFNFFPLFPRVHEDKFWGDFVHLSFCWFKIPSPNKAICFSFEVAPRHLYKLNNNKLPFGCHAWEKYDSKFWEDIISTER